MKQVSEKLLFINKADARKYPALEQVIPVANAEEKIETS